ncbi:MAG: hypothetical protein FD127_4122, partial [Acidimicrobiaceae bacterium]
MRRWTFLFVVLTACTVEGPADSVTDPGSGPAFLGGDGAAPTCSRPDDGCACETGAEPATCYSDPMPGEGGSTLCGVGVRHCRNGVWGTCEITGTYELEPSLAALVTVPRSCGICDPDCAYACDYPSAADLPGRGVGVVFDPAESGLVLPAGPGGGPGVLTDTDGDGVPDAGDECPGAGFRAPCTPGTADDGLVHTLAFGGPSASDPLNLTVTVRTADVYFLMDTTGSMGGEITNLRAGITTGTYVPGCPGGIMGAIRCIIPDAWFGVGHHDDFPYAPFGSAASGDVVYRNLQDITMSTAMAAAAVGRIPLHYGYDWPESQSQALWAVASGGGLGGYLSARTGCPAGTWGYPCFRNGTIPIVILFTDAPYHNGPFGYGYSGVPA